MRPKRTRIVPTKILTDSRILVFSAQLARIKAMLFSIYCVASVAQAVDFREKSRYFRCTNDF